MPFRPSLSPAGGGFAGDARRQDRADPTLSGTAMGARVRAQRFNSDPNFDFGAYLKDAANSTSMADWFEQFSRTRIHEDFTATPPAADPAGPAPNDPSAPPP